MATTRPILIALILSLIMVIQSLAGSGASIVSARGGAATVSTSAWLSGWPMVGHDPQRTNRSPATGPLHPHLLFARAGLDGPALIGPDGHIYSWAGKRLVALDSAGHLLWSYAAWEAEGGPPALSRDGRLAVNAITSSVIDTSTAAVLNLSPSGRLLWKIQPAGFSKSTPPLVAANNTVFVPFVGPTEANAHLEVVSPGGAARELQQRYSFESLARGRDGSLYAIGRYSSHEDSLSVERLTPRGKVIWRHTLPYDGDNVMVGHGGVLYVADGTNVAGAAGRSPNDIRVYTRNGQLRWSVHTNDGQTVLAERADGVVLAAGQLGLTAISRQGTVLWHVSFGAIRGYAVSSIAVDAAGTAYVGCGDSNVRVIGADERVLDTLSAGPPSTIGAPSVSIGADGRLLVVGTDRTLRVYTK